MLNEYQDDLRRACLIKNLADQMKDKGLLSPSEYREFLAKQAKKYSLDSLVLTR